MFNADPYRQGIPVKNLRLRVFASPELRKISPKRGDHQGKLVSLLHFRAVHTSAPANKAIRGFNSEWSSVECFNDKAINLLPILKEGMAIYVSGHVQERCYVTKEGTTKTSKTLYAKQIYLDLLQDGVREVTYIRPPKKGSTAWA